MTISTPRNAEDPLIINLKMEMAMTLDSQLRQAVLALLEILDPRRVSMGIATLSAILRT